MKDALVKFSPKNRGEKLLLVIQGAEKIGHFIEDSIFYEPPDNVVWMLISSDPIKVVLSKLKGPQYVHRGLPAFYLKPFHGVPIESFCRLRKIEETQVWGDLMDFLSRLPAFARDDGQPSNFLEALRMHIVDRELIQPWIKDALDKYGCFELFDNDMGRKMLLSVRTPKKSCDELAECASATEWLKKQKEVGRFIIEYCDKEREFKLTDKKIQGHPPPHYCLKESLLEGRRINVVATLLQDYSRSVASGTREAVWCSPPLGGRWNEVFNDHGEYARFNRVELETGGRTASEKGKDTSNRRVRSKPNVRDWC